MSDNIPDKITIHKMQAIIFGENPPNPEHWPTVEYTRSDVIQREIPVIKTDDAKAIILSVAQQAAKYSYIPEWIAEVASERLRPYLRANEEIDLFYAQEKKIDKLTADLRDTKRESSREDV